MAGLNMDIVELMMSIKTDPQGLNDTRASVLSLNADLFNNYKSYTEKSSKEAIAAEQKVYDTKVRLAKQAADKELADRLKNAREYLSTIESENKSANNQSVNRQAGGALYQAGRGLQSFGYDAESVAAKQLAELVRVQAQVEAVTAGFGGLGAALGPVSVAIAALIIGIHFLQQGAEQAAEASKEANKQLELYYKTIQRGTTESIQKSIQDNETDLAAKRAQIAALKAKPADPQTGLEGAFYNAQRHLEVFFNGVNKVGQAASDKLQTTEDLAKAQKELTALEATHKTLIEAAHSPQVAQNNAAQEWIKASQESLDYQKAHTAALKQSSSAINENLANLEDRDSRIKNAIATFEALKHVQGTSAEEVRIYNEELKKLREELADDTLQTEALKDALGRVELGEKIMAWVMAGVAAGKALEDMKKPMEDIRKENESYLSQLNKEAETKRRMGIEDNYNARINAAKAQELEKANNAKIDKLTKDHQDKEFDRLQKYLTDLAKLEIEYNKKRSRMVEDSNDDLTELAAKGDVAGFVLAQRKAQKELKRLDQDHADDLKARKEAYDEQTKANNDHYAEDLANLKEANANRTKESQRLQDELTELRRRWAEDDKTAEAAARQKAHDEKIADLTAKLNEEKAKVAAYWKDRQAEFESLVKSARDTWDTFLKGTGWMGGGNQYQNGLSSGLQGILQGQYAGGSQYQNGLSSGLQGLLQGNYGGGGGGNGGNGGLNSNLTIGDIHIGAGNAVSKKDVEMALQDFSNHIARHINGAGQ